MVPGVVESQSSASDKTSEFESKITVTKLAKSQQNKQSQSTQDQFSYLDVPPSTSKASCLFASQRKSSRLTTKTQEDLRNLSLSSSSIELVESFSKIDPSSFLSKHEKSKLNRSGVIFEKSKQVKRTNADEIVDSAIIIPESKKRNYEMLNQKLLQECFSVDEMVHFAKQNKFPKKYFLVNEKLTDFTTILHFFESTRTFTLPLNTKLRDYKIAWVCKICRSCKDAPLSRTTNLNKHLRNVHEEKELKEWFKYYNNQNNYKLTSKISKDHLDLIKYIIDSNGAIEQLGKKSLRRILRFEVPSKEKFRNVLLPAIMKKMGEAIETKLQSAESICLIVDLWCKNSRDFISLAAVMTNSCHDRSICVIDMQRMAANHTAENIKKAIEEMINKKNFDKKKIKGKKIINQKN